VAGCDSILGTDVHVELHQTGSVPRNAEFVVESSWFREAAKPIGAFDARAARAADGHRPMADWPKEKRDFPGVPVVDGAALLDFRYAGTSARSLGTTWIAVWRLSREEWTPQEFVLLDGDGGLAVHRLIRGPERGRLGERVGAPKRRPMTEGTTDSWRVVLPLQSWTRVRGR
jgi:hypothetical protein